MLVGWLFQSLDWGKVILKVQNTKGSALFIALCLQFALVFLDAERHRRILSGAHSEFKLKGVYPAKFLGLITGNFIPGGISGDAVRAYRLSQYNPEIPFSSVISSLLLSRIFGLICMLPLLALGLLSLNWDPSKIDAVEILAAFTTTLLVITLSTVLARKRRIQHSLQALVARYRYPIRKEWLQLVLLSFVIHFLNSLVVFTLCVGMSLDVMFMKLIWVTPSVGLISMLPISLGAYGTQDISWVELMAHENFQREALLGVSLLWHFLRVTTSLPGAFQLLDWLSQKNRFPVKLSASES